MPHLWFSNACTDAHAHKYRFLFVSLSDLKALHNRGLHLNWQALDLSRTADNGVYSELLRWLHYVKLWVN